MRRGGGKGHPEGGGRKGPPLVVIADDLTGAADTGVQFLEVLGAMELIHHRELAGGAGGWNPGAPLSIYTNTRNLPGPDAERVLAEVAQGLRACSDGWIYKKVDSCLRGNIGIEVEALMEGLGYDLSFIAPAFPQMGRTTADGIHKVHGVPVSETELGKDPVAPVRDSRIDRLVSGQCRWPVMHVSLDLLRGETWILRGYVSRAVASGVRHLTFDALTQSDLERIAQLALTVPWRVIMVGSAGLAQALVTKLMGQKQRADHASRPTFLGGSKLWIIGTASGVTHGQVKKLLGEYPFWELIVPFRLLAGPDDHRGMDDMEERLGEALSRGDALIRLSGEQQDRFKAPVEPLDPDRAVRGLARLARRAVEGVALSGVFLCGGDTAWAFLEELGCRGISLEMEILPGVPYGRAMGGPCPGLPIVTKAGAFGGQDTLVRLYEIWQRNILREDSNG